MATSSLLQRRRKSCPTVEVAPLRVVARSKTASALQSWCDGAIEAQYSILESIGRGSSGFVYRAKRKEDGREVALKCMSAPSDDVLISRRSEFEILRRLDHPNIVQCFDFISTEYSAVIALSYHAGNTLLRAVKDSPESCFTERVSQRLFRMLLSAIDYLHQLRIVHRDVKPENVLVSADLQDLHLADFNTARALLEGGSLTMTGTIEYSAPEVLQGESPSEQHDIWGAGLCLHWMLIGMLPLYVAGFPSVEAFAAAVCNNPVTCESYAWKGISQECRHVVRLCLTIPKDLRCAAMTLLALSWLRPTPEVQPRHLTSPLMSPTTSDGELSDEVGSDLPSTSPRSCTFACNDFITAGM